MKLNFKFTYQTPSILFPVGIIRIDNHQLLDKIISHFVREVPHSNDSACRDRAEFSLMDKRLT